MSAVVELRPNRGTPYDQAVEPKQRRRRRGGRQPRRALKVANHRRLAFGRFRQSLAMLDRRQARILVADMLESGALESVAYVKAEDFLLAVPGIGEGNLRRLLWRPSAPIWPRSKMGELSEAQRAFVAGELRKMGK